MTVATAGLPSWVWFATGLATGLFAALLIYIGFGTTSDTQTDPVAVDNPVPDTAIDKVNDGVLGLRDDIEWEFYEIFPRAEVPVSEVEPAAETSQPQTADGVYMLQVGSFQDPNDADALRANLILQGFEATLYEAEKDGQTWHRVIVGPVGGTLALSRMRTRLAEHDHPALTLRIR